jgi:hypothetical protein
MTRRKRLQPRRIQQVGLDANAEMVAVAWAGWWADEAASSRTWWQGIATVHGDRLRAKWTEAFPGSRPAFDWVVRLPEWPLLATPSEFDASRKWLDISGRRYWYCGSPWQPAQVDILRAIGEVDAGEYGRHREWLAAGAKSEYMLDEGWACSWLGSEMSSHEVCHER